jgi:hypothetical protein
MSVTITVLSDDASNQEGAEDDALSEDGLVVVNDVTECVMPNEYD